MTTGQNQTRKYENNYLIALNSDDMFNTKICETMNSGHQTYAKTTINHTFNEKCDNTKPLFKKHHQKLNNDIVHLRQKSSVCHSHQTSLTLTNNKFKEMDQLENDLDVCHEDQ